MAQPSKAPRGPIAAVDTLAVVTGAAGGIGRAVVDGLLEAGVRVVATDRSATLLAEAFAGEPHGRITTWALDVTDPLSVTEAAEWIEAACGPVGVLINNAGLFAQTPILEHFDEEAVRTIFEVNLLGTLRCSAAFAEGMANRKQGRIINVASISGLTGAALASAYAASKAGVIALTRSLARELGPAGVCVTALAPGFCDTPMMTPHKKLVEHFHVPRIPAGRVARPAELAEWIVFLATCRCGYQTGSVLTLDGGLTSG